MRQTNLLNMSHLKQVTLPLSLRICLKISGHPTKTVYRFATFPMDATCPPYLNTLNFIIIKINGLPIPVAARSKPYVYGRSLAGIVGSSLAGGMDVCLLLVLCVVR